MPKAVLAGGSGYLGSCVSSQLAALGWEVAILSRRPSGHGEIEWDGKTPGPWQGSLEGAQAVFNFSGASIARKFTPANKKLLRDSRVHPTLALARAVAACETPPPVWVNCCAAGIYGDRGEETLIEGSPPGAGFIADLCREWEASVMSEDSPRTRKVILRVGNVLGPSGGLLPKLSGLTRLFLGGAVGAGRQWMSWISETDFTQLALFVLEAGVEGPINAVGPSPVRNRELMAALRRRLGRPWTPNVPGWAVSLAANFGAPDPSLAMMSQRVLPARAAELGFVFQQPELDAALAAALG